tara:strand:- start:214 stop:447 length:234 start_codon:yes stop_codon:yes gene_type:complete
MARRKIGFFEAGVLQNLALLGVMAFAWTKLGVGAAVKELKLGQEYPPQTETGYLTQAEWQARYGGSQLDYEDWLRGQ